MFQIIAEKLYTKYSILSLVCSLSISSLFFLFVHIALYLMESSSSTCANFSVVPLARSNVQPLPSTSTITICGTKYYARSVSRKGLSYKEYTEAVDQEEKCHKIAKSLTSNYILKAQFIIPGKDDQSDLFIYDTFDQPLSEFMKNTALVEDEHKVTFESRLTPVFLGILR
ncbi:hypothetical protein Dimus_019442 [Dionaea muscipula]